MVKDDVGPWLWPTMKRVLSDLSEGKVFPIYCCKMAFETAY